MSDFNLDTVRTVDPTLAHHVERLSMVGDALANAEALNKQGDKSVEFSRFFGSLIYKLGEEQRILCELILVYCKYLETQISSSDHVRQSNLCELAKFAQQLEVKAEKALAQVVGFREMDRHEKL